MKRMIPALVAVLGLVALTFALNISNPLTQIIQSADITAAESKIPVLDDSTFKDTLENSKTIVVVDFYADWCGPCRAVAPSIAKLAKEYDGKILVVKVNVDYAPNVSRENGIRSIPTVAIFAPGSTKELDRKTGAYDYDSYKKWVDSKLK